MLPRTRAALALATVVVLAGASVAAAAPGGSGSQTSVSALPTLDAQIAAGINAARVQHGLPRLRISPALRAAAAAHSFEMARDGYFSHSSADGTGARQRLAHYYRAAGYHSWSIGETLLWYSPDVTAQVAVHYWLTSPEHRAILLTGSFREIGVSAVHVSGATGFDGSEVTLVTADFGVRTR